MNILRNNSERLVSRLGAGRRRFSHLSRRWQLGAALAVLGLLGAALFVWAELGSYGTNGPAAAPNSLDWGLVGYWDMEEGSGQTVRDKSGHGNDCRLGDETTVDVKDPAFGPGFTAAGAGGAGVVFDGINDYMDCGDDASLALTGAMTFGGWVRIDNLGEMHSLFGKGQGLGSLGVKGYVLSYHNSGVIYFDTYSADGTVRDSMTSESETITDTGWHHILGVWDGTTGARGKRIYIDGMLANAETSSIASVGSGSYTFEISSDTASPWSYLSGAADEIRVYNRALTDDEIRLLYNQKKPIAEYDFNEGAGSIAHDASFNHYDATLGAGSGSTLPTWVAGREGSGLSFDGVDDYVTRAVNLDGDDGSVAMWLKDPDPDYWGYMFTSDANTRTYLEVSYGEVIFTKSDPAVEVGAHVLPAATAGWHHYELTWHTVGTALYASSYVDGKPYGVEVAIADDTDGTFFTLGAWSATPEEFSGGVVDQLRLYNYARSADEVWADYNGDLAARFGAAGDRWYSEGLRTSWLYRRSVPVTSSQALDDYQVRLSLDTASLVAAGKLRSDCADLRFTGTDGVGALPYWIESDCNSAATVVWVKADLAPGAQNLYMYYANASAAPVSSGRSVFIVFEDFDAFDASRWTQTVTGAAGISFADGMMEAYSSCQSPAKAQLAYNTNPPAKNTITSFAYYTKYAGDPAGYMDGGVSFNHKAGPRVYAWNSINDLFYASSNSYAEGDVTTSYSSLITVDMVYTDSQAIVKKDGAQVGSALSYAAGDTAALSVGAWGADPNVKGSLYVKIPYLYSRQYTATEPTPGTLGAEQVQPRLVLDLDFDEGSGAVLHDKSSNHYDIAITGATWVPGVSGTALSFDGTDDEASATISMGSDEMTQSICVEELGGSQPWENYVIIYQDANNYFSLTRDDTLSWVIPVVRIGGAWADAPEVPFRSGFNCYTMVFSKAGDFRKTYVNGVLAGTYGEWDGGIFPTDLYISSETNAIIDNLRIYNHALTDAEVMTEYNAGVAAHLGAHNQESDHGLVGYWNMEEGSGLTLRDRSGNGNDGTLSTASATEHALPFFAPGHDERGENGSGLGLTGRSEFVNAGTGSSLQLTSAGTIALWVRPNALDQDDFANFVTKRATSSGGSYANYSYSFHWRGSEDLIRLAISDGVALDVATMPLPADLDWHYMVARWDGTDLRLYLDGVLAMTPVAQTRSAQAGASFPVALAGYAFSSSAVGRQEFNGTLDEIRVYDRALSEDEIRQLYNGKRPILEMNFDEGAGAVSYDESFNHNDGAISGAAWTVGKFGTALSFDGLDDSVSLAPTSLLREQWTVGAWVYPADTTSRKFYFSQGSGYFELTATGQFYVYMPSSGTAVNLESDAISYQANQWYFVEATYDGATANLYVNGVLGDTVTNPTGTSTAGNTYVGRYGSSSNYYFKGLIDDLQIYSYARSAQEALVDYNDGLAAHLR